MRIVGGLDIHRAQITFDCVDLRTGEEVRGQIRLATREQVRSFLASLGRKKAAFVLEATTGWRFIAEELERAGMGTHLAEPAETRAKRGNKHRAKTDRADARLLRDLLLRGKLPESWISPAHLCEAAHDGAAAQSARQRPDGLAAPHPRPALPSRSLCPAVTCFRGRTGVSGPGQASGCSPSGCRDLPAQHRPH